MVIKHKIGILGVIPVTALVVLVLFCWQVLSYTSGQFDEIVNNQFVTLIDNDVTPLIKDNMLPLINEDVKALTEYQDSIRLMLEADRDAHQAVIAEKMAIVASAEEEVAAADQANAENIDQAQTRMKKASAAFQSEQARKLYSEFEQDFAVWKEKSRKVIELAQVPGKLEFARKSSDSGSAATTFGTMRDKIDQLQGLLEEDIQEAMKEVETKKEQANAKEQIVTENKDKAVATAASVQSAIGSATLIFISIGIGCGVVVAVLAFLFSRSILKPLQGIIVRLSDSSEQITNSAGQVSCASQSLAEGATEQAAGLEETSSSLEEMASMTKQNADNASQANVLAEQARKAAQNGSESMGRMSGAIDDIQKSSDETAKIIKVIDEIAFQTNLLALNAAVEAARAGEAGKGFAVVAEEVRNLAMRSAEAAKDTSNLIEQSVKNSRNGVEISSEVRTVLGEIVESISKTTDLVGEIAAASQEQSQGIDQVNTAVAQMDKVTQQNAANAEESASASEEMNTQAVQMQQIVQDLISMVGKMNNISGAVPKSSSKKSLSRGDQLYHQIAESPKKKASGKKQTAGKTASVEREIPFDDDDFSDFSA